MKGIAGIIYHGTLPAGNLVETMLKALKHRGADKSDVQTYRNAQLGLAGSAISVDPQKKIYLGLDGTISNAEDISRKLNLRKLKNIQNTLILAYLSFGENFLTELTGDFAIFIFDAQQQKIILARDRIGKKPLYWFKNNNFFIFGSELKALMATGLIPQTPAMDAISSYLFFGYIPQDMSPIKNIYKLLPAHYLQYSFNGNMSVHSYWSYSSYFEATGARAKKSILRDLDLLLKKSVAACLRQEKGTSCALSGDLGSAAICAYLEQQLPSRKIISYTVDFLGEEDFRTKDAETTAKSLNVKHKTIYIARDDFLNDFIKICWYLDEPIANPDIIAVWQMMKTASEKSESIFTGIGSDELFAAHSRYTSAAQKKYFTGLLRPSIALFQKTLAMILSYVFKAGAYRLLKQSRTNPWQFDYLERSAIFNERQMKMAAPKLAGSFDPEVFLHKFHNLDKIESRISSYLYLDVKTRLADYHITKYEKLSAAHGLRWKAPYLNRQVVEFLAGIPEPEVLKESEAASFLKAIMKKRLPRHIINRPKRTEKDHLRNWLEEEKIVKLFKMLSRGNLLETGIISKSWLFDTLGMVGRSREAFRLLWAIFTLEVWFRIYITNPIESTPPEIDPEDLLSRP